MKLGPAILFCPADRPDRYAKAAVAADAVILDLEDAVAPADKAATREHVAASTLDPERTIVRVNPVGGEETGKAAGEMAGEHLLDLAALGGGPYRTLMLAKAESAEQLDHLQAAGYRVIALCETAAGVEQAFVRVEKLWRGGVTGDSGGAIVEVCGLLPRLATPRI